jgi:hypothetical protein
LDSYKKGAFGKALSQYSQKPAPVEPGNVLKFWIVAIDKNNRRCRGKGRESLYHDQVMFFPK